MPYISQDKRSALEFEGELPITPGDLNYAITSLVHRYITAKGKSYGTLNEAMGVVECVKQELYRTVAAPYEDDKRDENGPVSELDTAFEARFQTAEPGPAVDSAGIVAALTKVLEDKLGGAALPAPKRRRKAQEPPVPVPTSIAPALVPLAPAPAQAATSSVRRPAQVLGVEPGEEEAPPTLAIARPKTTTPFMPGSVGRGVDPHVASVWDAAANGNGEDDGL